MKNYLRNRVLVFANKQDLSGAMTSDPITEKLELCTIRGIIGLFRMLCC